ncbi:MAG: GNAT family N-acetyltransferase [Erysipelotrichaceae bacterium]|nr:GNAT family N-acetyltransferase [Erysipelotrichaceae bacterium]
MGRYRFDTVRPEYYGMISDYREEMLKEGSNFDGCSSLERYEDIEKWHLNCLLFERPDTVPPGYSIGFEYLYLNEEEVAGMVNLRPKALSHIYLKQYGGHIGYSVRPSLRKQGIGTEMLRDFLPVCKEEFHLDRVLITCLKDNEGSRRVIMNNGGVYENDIFYPPADEILERYWISL